VRKFGALCSAAIVVLLLVFTHGKGVANEDITGVWLVEDEDAAVSIEPCGDSRCGRIIWIKDPLDASGSPVKDEKNPNPSLRNRKVCGLQILSGVKRQTDGSWDGGRIYDPEEGKSYTAAIKREGSALTVTGYVSARMFGQSVKWRSAPKGLARCT